MYRASVVSLVSFVTTYDEIGQPVHAETKVDVPCTVGGITRSEWTAAGQMGFNPEVRLSMPSFNYGGQAEAVFEGATYSIYRTFVNGDVTELYLERKAGVKYVEPTPASV